jgi:hypothetical protein
LIPKCYKTDFSLELCFESGEGCASYSVEAPNAA